MRVWGVAEEENYLEKMNLLGCPLIRQHCTYLQIEGTLLPRVFGTVERRFTSDACCCPGDSILHLGHGMLV